MGRSAEMGQQCPKLPLTITGYKRRLDNWWGNGPIPRSYWTDEEWAEWALRVLEEDNLVHPLELTQSPSSDSTSTEGGYQNSAYLEFARHIKYLCETPGHEPPKQFPRPPPKQFPKPPGIRKIKE